MLGAARALGEAQSRLPLLQSALEETTRRTEDLRSCVTIRQQSP